MSLNNINMNNNYYMIYFLSEINKEMIENNIKMTREQVKNYILNQYLIQVVPKIKPTHEMEENDRQIINLCLDFFNLGKESLHNFRNCASP
jgi:hypothetical protein